MYFFYEYKAKRITSIDERLLRVRLPLEFSRATRSLNERGYFKTNEWRTMAFYLMLPLLFGYLKDEYFENLLKYVIFLRLLCQDEITDSDIMDAKELIIDFTVQFQDLYETDDMKFNLHAHLHLPSQVWKYGPLNKISCFPFENIFRISKDLYHGTTHLETQIARNFMLRKQNKLATNLLFLKTSNHNIKKFITNIIPKEQKSSIHLINHEPTHIYSLLEFERNILMNKFAHIERINQAKRAIIHNSGLKQLDVAVFFLYYLNIYTYLIELS